MRRVVTVLICLLFLGGGPAVTVVDSQNEAVQSPRQNEDLLIVDKDGKRGNYTSIQSAVFAADDGDTVRVLPGHYREAVFITANISLIAPRGATIGGLRGEYSAALAIDEKNSVLISGFTIKNISSQIGLKARGTIHDWVVRNCTFRNAVIKAYGARGSWLIEDSRFVNLSGSGRPFTAVSARNTSGSWTITDSTFRNINTTGVATSYSSSEWTIRHTRFHNISGYGVFVGKGLQNWTVRNSTFVNAGGIWAILSDSSWSVINSRFINDAGVNAWRSGGDWVIRNATFRRSGTAVTARQTTGDWRIYDSRFIQSPSTAVDTERAYGSWAIYGSMFSGNVIGVNANKTRAAWEIVGSTFVDNQVGVTASKVKSLWTIQNSAFSSNSEYAIVAAAAEIEGQTLNNTWNQSSTCIGNVTCGASKRKTPATPTRTETTTQPTRKTRTSTSIRSITTTQSPTTTQPTANTRTSTSIRSVTTTQSPTTTKSTAISTAVYENTSTPIETSTIMKTPSEENVGNPDIGVPGFGLMTTVLSLLATVVVVRWIDMYQ